MVSRKARSRLRLLPFLVALAGAATLIWSSAPTNAAWDGIQDVRLGDSMTAEFKGAPLTEVHKYTFFAPKDTILSTTVKVGSDAVGLTPVLKVYDSLEAQVDLGAAQIGTTVKNYKFLTTGTYSFQVRASAGTGLYTLSTKVKYPKSVSGATTTGSFGFDAVAGTALSAQVKATKGSTATPTITAVTYPGGVVNLNGQQGGTKISKVPLTVSKKFTMTIDPGTAGQSVDVKVTLAAPKTGRAWNFGYVENTTGLATANRLKWELSAHAALNTEPFTHWNNDNPPVIPTSCAKCHSGLGYRDFLGVDGTPSNLNDLPPTPGTGQIPNFAQPVGTPVNCDACHNDVTSTLTEVTLPSGKKLTGLGDESRCIVCHQGRESKLSMDTMLTTAAPTDDDTVDADIKFKNLHYFAAAASFYGREAGVAYEYNGKAYEKEFTHVQAYNQCMECHDPHSLKVRVNECASCHDISPANLVADRYEDAINDLHGARMKGTTSDFDGDGTKEGIYFELVGMSDVLYKAMQEYAADVVGKPLIYDGHTYPYWFEDKGTIGTFEPGVDTGFASWTARLVKTAFNYQMWQKDPGAFAHNGKYLMELMYDGIEELNSHALVDVAKTNGYTVDFADLVRNDIGHFDTSADAYTDWNATDVVSSSCVRCHSVAGFEFRLKYGIDATIGQETIAGMSCESCHAVGADFTDDGTNVPALKTLLNNKLEFYYPTTATSAEKNAKAQSAGAGDPSYLCMTCHQGRQSQLSVDASIASTSSTTMSVPNPHYFPAGAMQYGRWVNVGYQYTAKSYAARWNHTSGYDPSPTPNFTASSNNTWNVAMPASGQCTFCHMKDGTHTFEPEITHCDDCHSFTNSADISTINRPAAYNGNYDGDPATTTLKQEIDAIVARLGARIIAYAPTEGQGSINIDNGRFYKDNGKGGGIADDGIHQAGETDSYAFAKNPGKAVKAAYNYSFPNRDPGAWAHNSLYVIQLLIDSLEDIGGDLTGLNRPTQN